MELHTEADVQEKFEEKTKQETAVFQKKISELTVSNQKEYELANNYLREAKSKKKLILEKLDPGKKAAHAAYKKWTELIRELTEPLDLISKLLSRKISPYLQEIERKRQEALRKEREKIEQQRIEDAEVLAEQGLEEDADELLSKQTRVETSKIAPKMEKGGTFTTTRWHAEVVDKAKLIEAVWNNIDEISDFIIPNMPVLNRLAVDLKDKFDCPGVKAVPETTVSTRL